MILNTQDMYCLGNLGIGIDLIIELRDRKGHIVPVLTKLRIIL